MAENEKKLEDAITLLDDIESMVRAANVRLQQGREFTCQRMTKRELVLGLGGVTARALDDGRVLVEVRRLYSSGAHSYTRWAATDDFAEALENVTAAIEQDAEHAIALGLLRAKRLVAPSTN